MFDIRSRGNDTGIRCWSLTWTLLLISSLSFCSLTSNETIGKIGFYDSVLKITEMTGDGKVDGIPLKLSGRDHPTTYRALQCNPLVTDRPLSRGARRRRRWRRTVCRPIKSIRHTTSWEIVSKNFVRVAYAATPSVRLSVHPSVRLSVIADVT